MSLLMAFGPGDEWLGNGEMSSRTQLPRATVTRLARALVAQGYLCHAADTRRYRLAPRVLALGLGASPGLALGAVGRTRLRRFAGENGLSVLVASRHALEMVVHCADTAPGVELPVAIREGMRWSLADSAIGWALMAALPDEERRYLEGSLERSAPGVWRRHRRKVGEAIEQVRRQGYCWTVGARYADLVVVAVPLVVEGHAPQVLACQDASPHMSRARVARDLGPRLRGLAAAILKDVPVS